MAAKLAAKMGVYGTVLGAGVISVIATCGSSVFQHLFKSTGERVRGVTVQAVRPKASQVRPARQAGHAGQVTQAGQAGGRLPGAGGGFGEATTYGTRVRGWKRSAIAAVLVFGVAMTGITAYELMTGQDFSGGKGTTISGVVRGGDSGHQPSTTPSPTHQEQHQEQHQDERQQPERSPTPVAPGTARDGAADTSSPTPGPDSPTVPTPDPSSPTAPTPTPPPPTPVPTPTPTPSPEGSAE
ncbi:hypothetical protein [Streptomyces sp. NPDC000229]|uniref:hypothetical protein n=1 Tax=Streptomyces sp. NPDC000229 TaxID=3154247 RepID=UPI0033207C4B